MYIQKHNDVIIIGGGIIGCSIAYYLSRKNINSTVFESTVTGGEASSASAGMLGAMMETNAPGPLVELCLASQRKYASLAEELYEATGIDIEYVSAGTIGLARNEEEKQDLYKKQEWAKSLGQEVDWLDRSDLRKVEPLLSEQLFGGIHIPGDHQVNSSKVTHAFRLGASMKGARFHENTPVHRLLVEGNKVVGVETAAGQFTADKVILAAGSWSGGLLKPLGISLTVFPVKGQCYSAMMSTPLRKSVFAKKCYLIPKKDGTVLVGATQEEVGFDKETKVEAIKYLHDIASTLVPEMKSAVFVKTWAGLRPGNPNIKPFLGSVSEWDNLILATGHFRKGTLLSPITGEVITSIITGESAPLDWSPFTMRGHGLQID